MHDTRCIKMNPEYMWVKIRFL